MSMLPAIRREKRTAAATPPPRRAEMITATTTTAAMTPTPCQQGENGGRRAPLPKLARPQNEEKKEGAKGEVRPHRSASSCDVAANPMTMMMTMTGGASSRAPREVGGALLAACSPEVRRMVRAAAAMQAKPAVGDTLAAAEAALRAVLRGRHDYADRAFLQRVLFLVEAREEHLDCSDGLCAAAATPEDFSFAMSVLGSYPHLRSIDVSNGCFTEQGLAILQLLRQNRGIVKLTCRNTSVAPETLTLLAEQCMDNGRVSRAAARRRVKRDRVQERLRQEAENVTLSTSLVAREARVRGEMCAAEEAAFRKLKAVEHMANVKAKRATAFRLLRERQRVQRSDFSHSETVARSHINRREAAAALVLLRQMESLHRAAVAVARERSMDDAAWAAKESWAAARMCEEERRVAHRRERANLGRLETEGRKVVIAAELQLRALIAQSDAQLKAFIVEVLARRAERDAMEQRRLKTERDRREKEQNSRREKERAEEQRRATERTRERDRMQVRANQVMVMCERQEFNAFNAISQLLFATAPLAVARGALATCEVALARFCALECTPVCALGGLRETYTYVDCEPRPLGFGLMYTARMPPRAAEELQDLVERVRALRKQAVISLLEARRRVFVDSMELSVACAKHQVDLSDIRGDFCPRATEFVHRRSAIAACVIHVDVRDAAEEQARLRQEALERQRIAERLLPTAPSGRSGGRAKAATPGAAARPAVGGGHSGARGSAREAATATATAAAAAAEEEEEQRNAEAAADAALWESRVPDGISEILTFNLNRDATLAQEWLVEASADNRTLTLRYQPEGKASKAATPRDELDLSDTDANSDSEHCEGIHPMMSATADAVDSSPEARARRRVLRRINAALSAISYTATADTLDDAAAMPHSFRSAIRVSVNITIAAVTAEGLDARGRLCAIPPFTGAEELATSCLVPIDVHPPYICKGGGAGGRSYDQTSCYVSIADGDAMEVRAPRRAERLVQGPPGGGFASPATPVLQNGLEDASFTGYRVSAALINPCAGDTLALRVNTHSLQLDGGALTLNGAALTVSPQRVALLSPPSQDFATAQMSLVQNASSDLDFTIGGCDGKVDLEAIRQFFASICFAVPVRHVAVCGRREVELRIADDNGIECRCRVHLDVTPIATITPDGVALCTALRLRPFFQLCAERNSNLAALHLSYDESSVALFPDATFFLAPEVARSASLQPHQQQQQQPPEQGLLDKASALYIPVLSVRLEPPCANVAVTLNWSDISGLVQGRGGRCFYFGDDGALTVLSRQDGKLVGPPPPAGAGEGSISSLLPPALSGVSPQKAVMFADEQTFSTREGERKSSSSSSSSTGSAGTTEASPLALQATVSMTPSRRLSTSSEGSQQSADSSVLPGMAAGSAAGFRKAALGAMTYDDNGDDLVVIFHRPVCLNELEDFIRNIVVATPPKTGPIQCGAFRATVRIAPRRAHPAGSRADMNAPAGSITHEGSLPREIASSSSNSSSSGSGGGGVNEEGVLRASCEMHVVPPHMVIGELDQRRKFREGAAVASFGPFQPAPSPPPAVCAQLVDCFNGGYFRAAIVQGAGAEDLLVLRSGCAAHSVKLELLKATRKPRVSGVAMRSHSVFSLNTSTITSPNAASGGASSGSPLTFARHGTVATLASSLAAGDDAAVTDASLENPAFSSSQFFATSMALHDGSTTNGGGGGLESDPVRAAGGSLANPPKRKAPSRLPKLSKEALGQALAPGSSRLLSVLSNRRGTRFAPTLRDFKDAHDDAVDGAGGDGDGDEKEGPRDQRQRPPPFIAALRRLAPTLHQPAAASAAERCRNAIRDHIRQATAEYGALSRELRRASLQQNVQRHYRMRRAATGEVIGEVVMSRTDLCVEFAPLRTGARPLTLADVRAIIDAAGYVCDPCSELTHSKKFLKMWLKAWDGTESQAVVVADIEKTENFPLLQVLYPRQVYEPGQYQTACIGSGIHPIAPYAQALAQDFSASSEGCFDGGQLCVQLLNPREGDALCVLSREEHAKMKLLHDTWRQEQLFLLSRQEPIDAHIEELLTRFAPYDGTAELSQTRNLVKSAPGGRARSKADEEKATLGFCYTEGRTDMIRLAFHQHSPSRIDSAAVCLALNSFGLKCGGALGERVVEVRLKKGGPTSPESRVKIFVDVRPPKLTVGSNRGFATKSVARVAGEWWPVLEGGVHVALQGRRLRNGFLEARIVGAASDAEQAAARTIEAETLSFRRRCGESDGSSGSSSGGEITLIGPDVYVDGDYVGKCVAASAWHVKMDFDWASVATEKTLTTLLSALSYSCTNVPRQRVVRQIEVLLGYGASPPSCTLVTCAMTVEGDVTSPAASPA